jgi:predicted NAD/FAD-binding protein
MDFFVDEKKNITGYNTSMNIAYRLSDKTPYAFSYNLERMIRPEAILDKQQHVVPVYTGEAFGTRPEIKERNGENHCYYAGAWLGNGLHEGAVSSAVEVARKFGVQW